MNELFRKLGYSDKEANCYKILIESGGGLTASNIAKAIKETRTNTYMILERLEKADLIETDETQAVRRYIALDPVQLRQLVVAKQEEIKHTQRLLAQSLPDIQSLFNLGKLKPGVVYLEGLRGLEIILEDAARSMEEVLLIPGSKIEGETWETLKRGIEKRAKKGVKTRAIFPENSRQRLDKKLHKKQKFEVRYWGKTDYPGEVVIYGNKCVFTAYEPQIINTILTNEAIATTLRGVFENLWQEAKI